MPLRNFLADGESHACPWILATAVQPLKDDEDAFRVRGINADTIVPNGEEPFACTWFSRDMNAGRLIASELNRVADEVLKQLTELRLIAHHRGQMIVAYYGSTLTHCHLEIVEDILKDFLAIGQYKRLATGSHS